MRRFYLKSRCTLTFGKSTIGGQQVRCMVLKVKLSFNLRRPTSKAIHTKRFPRLCWVPLSVLAEVQTFWLGWREQRRSGLIIPPRNHKLINTKPCWITGSREGIHPGGALMKQNNLKAPRWSAGAVRRRSRLRCSIHFLSGGFATAELAACRNPLCRPVSLIPTNGSLPVW